MAGKTEIVYEVRCGGRVLAQFASESKAKSEMRRARKEGREARVYSKWLPVRKVKVPKKQKKETRNEKPRTVVAEGRITPNTHINAWLGSKGLEAVDRNLTFQERKQSTEES